jgi:ABC-type transport system involved in multi-copper enzyme maturation permease subunit
MLAMLRKDWRLNRFAVASNVGLIAIIYGLSLIPLAYGTAAFLDTVTGPAIGSMMVTGLLAAVYGGVAFANERRERSANFLAMLPARRGLIVLSKVVVAGVCLLAVELLNLAFAAGLIKELSGQIMDDRIPKTVYQFAGCVAAATVMLFGVAWLCSTFLESPAISASVSIGITGVMLTLITSIIEFGDYPRGGRYFGVVYELQIRFCTWCSLLMGIISFSVGTIYYLRRVEP